MFLPNSDSFVLIFSLCYPPTTLNLFALIDMCVAATRALVLQVFLIRVLIKSSTVSFPHAANKGFAWVSWRGAREVVLRQPRREPLVSPPNPP